MTYTPFAHPGNMISVRMPTLAGTLCATVNEDPDYPGIDIEFIADNDDCEVVSRPRILVEAPVDDIGVLRALMWRDPKQEDYTDELILTP